MQRQRSILSFLHRPSPDLHVGEEEQKRSSLASDFPAKELFPEVRGTDTPPEKLRRPFISVGDQPPGANGSHQPLSFASIMHKFIREDRSRISDKGNSLTDDIPYSISKLKQLEELNLKNNQLTGPIPSTLSHIPNLKTLDLAQSQLVGDIPRLIYSNEVL